MNLKQLRAKHDKLEEKCFDLFSVTMDDINELVAVRKKIHELKLKNKEISKWKIYRITFL